MSARNRTKADAAPDWGLSPQQETAVDLLVAGKTIQATAETIDVRRATVSEGVNHHPGFMAALNLRRQECWREVTAGLRALAPKALAVLATELDSAAPLAAAVHVLKACGVYGNVPLAGSTEPDEIAAEQQLAEDAREHAAETAWLTIESRASNRMFDALAAGLNVAPGRNGR